MMSQNENAFALNSIPARANTCDPEIPARQKVLVLDLDETLIHCENKPFENATTVVQLCMGDKETMLFISERPGLQSFIRSMSKIYRLVLYTSALKEYAQVILKITGIDEYFSEILHRADCQLNRKGKLEKNLAILGIENEDIILVDDSFVHIRNQPNNILVIKPYNGESGDCELYSMAQFLIELAKDSDVRPVMGKFVKFNSDIEPPTLQRIDTANRYLSIKSLAGLRARYNPDFGSSQKETDLNLSDTEEDSDESDIGQKLSQLSHQKSPPFRTSVFKDQLIDQIRMNITRVQTARDIQFPCGSIQTSRFTLNAEEPIVDKLPLMNLKPQSLRLKNCRVLG